MIRKFGGSSGVDSQPAGIDIGVGGGSNIKSIQRGTLAMTSNYQQITISEVDLSKSIIMISYTTHQNAPSDYCLIGKFISSTIIQFNHNRWISQQTAVSWEVIEFKNVKSMQSGTSTITYASSNPYINTVISPVTIQNCILVFSYTQSGQSTVYGVIGKIVDTTTINFSTYDIGGGGDTVVVYWRLIEFN